MILFSRRQNFEWNYPFSDTNLITINKIGILRDNIDIVNNT